MRRYVRENNTVDLEKIVHCYCYCNRRCCIADYWQTCAQATTNYIRSRDIAASDRCHSDIDAGGGGRCGSDAGR